MKNNGYLFIFIFCCTFVFCSVNVQAFDAAQKFDKKCASCHTIGDGDLIGPDLKGISKKRDEAWLVKFIQSPDDMIQAGDPEAVKLYNKYEQMDMPDQKLSKEQIIAILKFIESGGKVDEDLNVKSATKATKEDIEQGKLIFLGSKRLTNGGPACISCHSAGESAPLGGGSLAKDLTNVYGKFKDKGISVALSKLAFPVMSTVYDGKQLTDEENFQIKSFLYAVNKEGSPQSGTQKKFLFLALGGLIITMGMIDFTWRRRRKNSVRNDQGGIR
jgi:mono/diheme cytochrome c family protein